MWEDDSRRLGMRRRGPSTDDKRKDSAPGIWMGHDAATTQPGSADCHVPPANGGGSQDQALTAFSYDARNASNSQQLTVTRPLNAFPRALGARESSFLEHYVSRFSRTYPTCSTSGNPFLTVLMPLAIRSDVVLDSILALSGATRWNNGQVELEGDALRFRQKALTGCMSLVDEIGATSKVERKVSTPPATALGDMALSKAARDEKLLHLLASSVLFLLYEKVTGDTTWLPHITFINELFDRYLQPILAENTSSSDVIEIVGFLHQLFLYNDLVRATSTHTAPLSGFYLANSSGAIDPDISSSNNLPLSASDRYCFPNLISRISSGDCTVTEADIEAWGGSMDWLPSFALDTRDPEDKVDSDLAILSNLYRTTAKIYRLRVFTDRGLPTEAFDGSEAVVRLSQLACLATNQLMLLPEGSVYETALLWSIGIAAKELVQSQRPERDSVISRLRSMERRFQMRHFRRAQEFLCAHWRGADTGAMPGQKRSFSSPMSLLLG